MKNKTTVLLDDSARAIAQGCGNVSQYLGNLMTRNWAQWRRALIDVRKDGMTLGEIEEACRSLNGAWLVPDSAAAMLNGGAKGGADQLATLAWEYWHGNDELRTMLGEQHKAEPPDDDEDDEPPAKPVRGRPVKKRNHTKAEKGKT